MFAAACEGHAEAVEALIELGEDVNCAFMDGSTSVSVVARNGRAAVAAALGRVGAEVNRASNKAQTPARLCMQRRWAGTRL